MESRVLTGAPGIRGLPFIRKPAARFTANCGVPALKSTGTFNDGGNLIWGNQLRPAILLEASAATVVSPVTKREYLPPCPAAASSSAEGSDSSGWGPFYSIQLIWTELFSSCNCPKFLTRFLRRPVGFFQKYPAIVTGFFFFMWYVTWFLWSEYQLGLRNLFTIFSSLFQVLPERNFQHSQQEDLQLLPLSLVRIPLYILMLFFS